jgi:signal transduction histidine kinase
MMRVSKSNLSSDEKTEITITRLLYLLLFIGGVLVIAKNTENRWLLFFLTGLLIISITVRRAIIYESADYLYLGKFNFLLDLALVFAINHLGRSFVAYLFYPILIIDASLTYSTGFTGIITLAGFILQEAERYPYLKQSGFSSFLSRFLIDVLIFVGIYLWMTFIRYQIQQKEQLRQVMYQLKIKTKELENTNQKLKETTMELEDITVLRERNRIAREIHDTVGHTLTTVLLELEAGERLIPLEPAVAVTKIKLAKTQVRKGLNDIRASVETLKSGNEMLDFMAAVKLLIHETMLHGEVHIKYSISELPPLTVQQEKTLFRALQEGLTNGIRHGKSTAFVFNLRRNGGLIEFFLQDNGTGAAQIVPGFGLTAMNERVKELGGIFSIHSKPGEGCLIRVSLPIQEDYKNHVD